MPRKATDTDHLEDTMDDSTFDDWEEVATSRGTKIEWNVGTRFVGVYLGTDIVPLKEDAEEDNELDTAPAARFERAGEKFWSWQPYALKEAIDAGKLQEGQTVFIECTGEESTKRNLNKVKTFTIKVKPN